MVIVFFGMLLVFEVVMFVGESDEVREGYVFEVDVKERIYGVSLDVFVVVVIEIFFYRGFYGFN